MRCGTTDVGCPSGDANWRITRAHTPPVILGRGRGRERETRLEADARRYSTLGIWRAKGRRPGWGGGLGLALGGGGGHRPGRAAVQGPVGRWQVRIWGLWHGSTAVSAAPRPRPRCDFGTTRYFACTILGSAAVLCRTVDALTVQANLGRLCSISLASPFPTEPTQGRVTWLPVRDSTPSPSHARQPPSQGTGATGYTDKTAAHAHSLGHSMPALAGGRMFWPASALHNDASPNRHGRRSTRTPPRTPDRI